MRNLLLVAAIAIAGCGGRSPAAETPEGPPTFSWPVATGWRSETIPFPLEFAPGIKHVGVEELRFAPGFFDPEAPGYWTYAFVWVIDDEIGGMDALARELVEYFRGLTLSVAAEKPDLPPIDTAAITVELDDRGAGKIVTFDAFGDGRRVELDATAEMRRCGRGSAVVVTASRPAMRAEVEAVARAFTCE